MRARPAVGCRRQRIAPPPVEVARGAPARLGSPARPPDWRPSDRPQRPRRALPRPHRRRARHRHRRAPHRGRRPRSPDSRIDARLRGLTRGEGGTSLEAVLDSHLDKVDAVAREIRDLDARMAVLEAAQRRSFQRVGLVRYNPFEETGGNRGFALALLEPPCPVRVRSTPGRSGARSDGVRRIDGAPPTARRWPDRLAVTAVGDGSVMAPTTAAPTDPDHRDPPTRPPPARTVAARPAAGVERARARDGAITGGRDTVRARGAPRWAQPGPVARGHPRHRTAPRGRGGGHRQDPGHHATDRLADRDATVRSRPRSSP